MCGESIREIPIAPRIQALLPEPLQRHSLELALWSERGTTQHWYRADLYTIEVDMGLSGLDLPLDARRAPDAEFERARRIARRHLPGGAAMRAAWHAFGVAQLDQTCFRSSFGRMTLETRYAVWVAQRSATGPAWFRFNIAREAGTLRTLARNGGVWTREMMAPFLAAPDRETRVWALAELGRMSGTEAKAAA